MHDEIVVDLFAGGGGASDGIELALGRPVTIAINHSRTAIECHQRNHPHTHHEIADVWEVDPVEACAGRPVALLWASPSCTHYSRAKGGHNPKSAEIRSLPWVVIRWARTVRPRMIFMENVPEFLDWGPLDEHGHPIKSKRGRTFRIWLGKLKAQGYQVEWRTLVAADYGAPTTRKRVYLIARCDGQPIAWPEPTHAKHPSLWCSPWRTAAECIDWSLATRSIFDRKKPLAEKTLKRIAAGIVRYVLRAQKPFVVSLAHHGGERTHSVDAPLPTVTAANRGELALVAPTLVQTGYGEREGQEPRAMDVRAPLGTVVAGGQKHALCAALLTKHFGGVVGHDLRQPTGAITAKDHHALTTAMLDGARDRREQVRAFLISYYGADGKPETQKQSLEQPLGTVTTRDRFALVTVNGVEHEISDIGTRMLAPHELFAAQGFRTTYDLSGLTKTQQIQLCGNSVCPPVAEALVRANATPAVIAANDNAKRGAA
ncbi:MAG: DNA cytosine methyltransferase [Polyangiales bacterium]